jgi:serpin B
MKYAINIALVVAIASVVACSSSPSPSDGKTPVETVRSSLARETTPLLTPVELDTLTSDEASFAVDLYHAVGAAPENAGRNVFLSPHSVSAALAMTYAGARGETRDEMRKALHFSLPDDRLHRGFDYLDLALTSRQHGQAKDGRPFTLRIANSVWGEKSFAFQAPFLDTLAVSYGAGVNVVDFVGAPSDARATINRWTSDNTEGRIKNLMPEDSIDTLTRLVLVNAVYFSAAWQTKFIDGATAPAAFTTLDASVVQTPMMHAEIKTGYVKGDGYEAIELPYDGGDTSLLVIAPTTGSFASFDAALTGGKVLDVLAGLTTTPVALALPKSKLAGSYPLKAPLASLGMKAAFGGGDFSGISTSYQLALGGVFHQTSLDLDEGGTEAAAATGVDVDLETSDPPPVQFVPMTVDRPYVIAIVDRATKTLLFMGRIVDPR